MHAVTLLGLPLSVKFITDDPIIAIWLKSKELNFF